jgi:hypothetical protein
VVGIVLAGTILQAVYTVSAYLRMIVTSSLEINVSDLEQGITSHNLNILITGKEIDCHPSPVITLLSMSDGKLYHAVIHLGTGSISCHPSPAEIPP